jgi:hypothetical protein
VRLLSFPRSILGASFAADRLSFSAWHFIVKFYYVAKGGIDCRRWFRIEEMLWVVRILILKISARVLLLDEGGRNVSRSAQRGKY